MADKENKMQDKSTDEQPLQIVQLPDGTRVPVDMSVENTSADAENAEEEEAAPRKTVRAKRRSKKETK